MAKTRDVVAYLTCAYPHKRELSRARLTKMVYLADWRAAIILGRQITDIGWIYNYYGPYVPDVFASVAEDDAFTVETTANVYGGKKELLTLTGVTEWPSLTADEVEILDFVISKTSPLYWNQFIQLVYSTYPIASQPRFAPLELPVLASEYRNSPSFSPETARK